MPPLTKSGTSAPVRTPDVFYQAPNARDVLQPRMMPSSNPKSRNHTAQSKSGNHNSRTPNRNNNRTAHRHHGHVKPPFLPNNSESAARDDEEDDEDIFCQISTLIQQGQQALKLQKAQLEINQSRRNSPHSHWKAIVPRADIQYNAPSARSINSSPVSLTRKGKTPQRNFTTRGDPMEINDTPIKSVGREDETAWESPQLKEEMARARARYMAGKI